MSAPAPSGISNQALGTVYSNSLSSAILDLYLGEEPVSAKAKVRMGFGWRQPGGGENMFKQNQPKVGGAESSEHGTRCRCSCSSTLKTRWKNTP